MVVLRLASRLQTLRYLHAHKKTDFDDVAKESLLVFAPLANRLGIWQIKWEMEDLAFRLLEPDTYKKVAGWLEDKRVEREAQVAQLRQLLADQAGLETKAKDMKMPKRNKLRLESAARELE